MNSIKDITPRELVTGFTGRYVHGKDLTLGYVEIKAGNKLPEHHHVHEQITFIIEGQLDMTIGGKSCSLTAGMYYVIPSNVPHSAIAATDCKAIDVFNPVREDYK
ncbi:MAG TPA: cupin domain-containing protein [Chitinophagaceae bacterium]|nr:cupin domain-containing protein [Chitinophagaceae bacterium]